MDHNLAIGSKIKQFRTAKGYTLKQLSEETGFSVGFLSQLERGISTAAIDSLAKLASVFDVPLTSFFDSVESPKPSPVMRDFELQPSEISPHIYQYILSQNPGGFHILPRMYLLMPFDKPDDDIQISGHQGEEWIYMLEGILTVYIANQTYELYPGNSIHFDSTVPHNWMNRTGRAARFLAVNFPNPLEGNPDANLY